MNAEEKDQADFFMLMGGGEGEGGVVDVWHGGGTLRKCQGPSPCGFWRLEHPQSSINAARFWNTRN